MNKIMAAAVALAACGCGSSEKAAEKTVNQ